MHLLNNAEIHGAKSYTFSLMSTSIFLKEDCPQLSEFKKL